MFNKTIMKGIKEKETVNVKGDHRSENTTVHNLQGSEQADYVA